MAHLNRSLCVKKQATIWNINDVANLSGTGTCNTLFDKKAIHVNRFDLVSEVLENTAKSALITVTLGTELKDATNIREQSFTVKQGTAIMNKQQGAAALLVVSVLLVAALMMSLGSYKSLFYQIKRANNQIEARQEHWRAEGIECFILCQSTGDFLQLANFKPMETPLGFIN